MSRPKALIKEEVPDNVVGQVAVYLAKTCGVPGCSPVFHMDNAKEILTIIVDYNKNTKETKEVG